MALPDLDKVIEQIKELELEYERIEDTEVPHTLKEAMSGRWQLAAKGAVASAQLAYLPEEQRLDGHRVVKMSVVIGAMAEMEEEIVQASITRPVEGMWKKAHLVWGVGAFLAANSDLIWGAIREAWNEFILELALHPDDISNAISRAVDSLITLGKKMAAHAIAIALAAFAVKWFQQSMTITMRSRDKYCERVRKRALPQSSGKRLWRRKVAIV